MNKFLTRAIAGAALLSLGACASHWDIDGVAATPNAGDAFTKALQTRYLERARFEKGESDWYDVDYFTKKARQASTGIAPAPQHPSERGLAGNAEVKASHEKLVAALAVPNATKDAPDACALAQTWHDHWLEQLEEGFQADHIAEAKDGYNKAIPLCVPKPVVVAAPPSPKVIKQYVVYFDLGKSVLTPTAKKTLVDVVKDESSMKPTSVYLAGHTDTSGSAKTNEALSIKRTETVAKELAKMGVPTKVLDLKSLGETKLAVPTKDGVVEAKNRRVEVYFEK
ncbi:OmpA family protein [Magnetospirillum sulfuroxidans]|uniref:OmpA family protein n=1 Tax=Magnetospirillum sulfuroxidans TaxID=611300 RepID=A0ABS5IBI9_9PROT|nr:OmpA family protein [Magnetospirillum sulfuroxidans]MBR9971641.1 OmpA family protein [Magnetospirillum sulfuroxidans]